MNNVRLEDKIEKELDSALEAVRVLSGSPADLLINEFECGGVASCLLGCEGMFSSMTMGELVLTPLTAIAPKHDADVLFEHIDTELLVTLDRKRVENYGGLFDAINSGFAVLLSEGADGALAFGVQGFEKKSIGEPNAENNIMGADEALTENIRTNISLLRRRMKSPVFRVELQKLGNVGRTEVGLCWLADRVEAELLDEVREALRDIKLELLLTSGYIQPFLENKRWRLFSGSGTSQRPDVVCSKLLEGRIGLLVDGTPHCIVAPKLFIESFQTLDDYAVKPFYACFIRWVKYIAFFITILLPAVYVAAAVHNPAQLDPTLLMLLAGEAKNAPFSMLSQMAGTLLMYEVIREAGLRLPKAVGGSVSLVAGLIIGDAAVTSGLVSTPLLTVAALAIVSGFVIPDINAQLTALRLGFLVAGGAFGLTGLTLAAVVMLANICSTECFGYPITSALSPFSRFAMRDVAMRMGLKRQQFGDFQIRKLK